MRVRIKFVLILTLVVSIIMLVSFLVIYSLYARTRKKEFDKRLWARAYSEYADFYSINSTENDIRNKLEAYLPGAPIQFRSVLVNSSFNVIQITPASANFKVDTTLLLTVKALKEVDYTEGDLQVIAIYLNMEGHECYSIASGLDKYGLARLASLRLIIFFVALGSVITVGLFALYYVIVVTRPLVDISVQMRRISESNLSQRVKVERCNIKNNEMVQIATNFNSMLERLAKAFQMQRNFVHHASHELRTPLATILSQTEAALRRDLNPAEYRNVLESLKEDQMAMIELTNSLLLLSQYEHINYSPEMPPVRLDEIIYDTIAGVKKLLKDVNVRFLFADDFPVDETMLSVPGNEAMLRSAFKNLIKNAYKYSDDNSVQIILEPKENVINIYFDNNGPVMTAEESERAALPFFRGQNAQQKKGFGLGLSIVKRILDIHKAAISYQPIDGRINRFIVSFQKGVKNK